MSRATLASLVVISTWGIGLSSGVAQNHTKGWVKENLWDTITCCTQQDDHGGWRASVASRDGMIEYLSSPHGNQPFNATDAIYASSLDQLRLRESPVVESKTGILITPLASGGVTFSSGGIPGTVQVVDGDRASQQPGSPVPFRSAPEVKQVEQVDPIGLLPGLTLDGRIGLPSSKTKVIGWGGDGDALNQNDDTTTQSEELGDRVVIRSDGQVVLPKHIDPPVRQGSSGRDDIGNALVVAPHGVMPLHSLSREPESALDIAREGGLEPDGSYDLVNRGPFYSDGTIWLDPSRIVTPRESTGDPKLDQVIAICDHHRDYSSTEVITTDPPQQEVEWEPEWAKSCSVAQSLWDHSAAAVRVAKVVAAEKRDHATVDEFAKAHSK